MKPYHTEQKWYKTKAGKIFLGILTAFLLIIIIFSGMVAYYFWQINYGDYKKIEKEFTSQFTIDPEKKSLKGSSTISEDINTFIRKHNPVLGEKDAPVTIIEFIDFECPFCQASYPIFKGITERYGQIVRVVFKHLPVSSIHPLATQASLAAACANEQGKFWEYYNLLFTKKKLEDGKLFEYAAQLNLNAGQFKKCVEEKKYMANIKEDLIDAAKLEIRGTPTYIIGSIKMEGVVPAKVWDALIISEMRNNSIK